MSDNRLRFRTTVWGNLKTGVPAFGVEVFMRGRWFGISYTKRTRDHPLLFPTRPQAQAWIRANRSLIAARATKRVKRKEETCQTN